MRMVSGLIRDPIIYLEKDVTEENVIPAGYYITVKQYAEYSGKNESTVRSMISRGKIKSYFWEGKRVIPVKFGSESYNS